MRCHTHGSPEKGALSSPLAPGTAVPVTAHMMGSLCSAISAQVRGGAEAIAPYRRRRARPNHNSVNPNGMMIGAVNSQPKRTPPHEAIDGEPVPKLHIVPRAVARLAHLPDRLPELPPWRKP